MTALWSSLPQQMRTALAATLICAVLIIYPFADQALNLGTVYAVSDSMIYVILALGLNIVVGYAGLLDLGYAAFFAIGAYTMGIFNSPLLGFEWGFWNVIWLSAIVSAAFGLLIGAPTLRVRGDYLAIITLAFGEIIPVTIRNLGDVTIQIGSWQPVYRLNLTGGENGVNPIGQPHLFDVPFATSAIPWYFLLLIVGGVSVWAMNSITRLAPRPGLDGHPRGRDSRRMYGSGPHKIQAPGLCAGRNLLGICRIYLRRQASGHHARCL